MKEIRLSGGQCIDCGWMQSLRYFHKISTTLCACIQCGRTDINKGTFKVDPRAVVFGNPIYDKHNDRYYIQVGNSNYFMTFKCDPFYSTSPCEDTIVTDAFLIYLVSGTSSDIVVIADGVVSLEGPNSVKLGQNMIKFYHILKPILGQHTDLKRELNSSSMIRGIRGILHDGAQVIVG